MQCPACGHQNPAYVDDFCSACHARLDDPKYKSQSNIESSQTNSETENINAENIHHITISTCTPHWQFDIVDTIFAIDSHEQGFLSHVVEAKMGTKLFGGANPSRAFDGVKNQLRIQCANLNGDAVIGCQFEHRAASTSGMFGAKQAIEIFAYGTVIKRVATSA